MQLGHKHTGSVAQNQKAQLATAYNELGKELSSTKIKVVGNYTLGKVIGEGAYGKVRMGTHRLTSSRVAIKQIPKALSSSLTREIHHHRQLHHPHVTQLYEVIATESSIWLVTELCSGGELFDYLTEKGRLSEDETRIIFGQLCLAVNYVHEKGIVHRDLKLENVLLDERCRVKLGDFGFTREFERGSYLETYCGTTGYASPEMLEGRKYLGPEVDVWSLGVILYCLLTGTLPFDDDDESVMRQKVIKGEFEDPDWLSDDVRDLIQKILQKDPNNRLTIQQILAHPWFTNHVPLSRSASPAMPRSDSAASHPTDSHASYDASASSVTSESTFPSLSEVDRSSATTPDDDMSHESHAVNSDEEHPALHRNPSLSTIKKVEGAIKGKSKSKKSKPETVVEEDPPPTVIIPSHPLSSSLSSSRPISPTSSSRGPPALPTRTPVRTKRRSVSSTLSDPSSPTTEKSNTPLPHQDFASLLNTPAPIIFGTPLERELLNNLSSLGFDTGQIVHSVLSNACDSAGAVWWMLKRRAEKRAVEENGGKAMLAQITEREVDDPDARGSVEMKKRSRSPPADDAPTPHAPRVQPSALTSAQSAPELALIPATPTVPTHQRPTTPPRARSPNQPFLSPTLTVETARSHPSTPANSLKDEKGSKGRRESKARSGSVSIMQRATTALEAAGLVRKKSAEAVKEKEARKEKEKELSVDESRSSHGSSGKLTKSPPLKPTKGDAIAVSTQNLDNDTFASAAGVSASPWVVTGMTSSPPASPVHTAEHSPGDTLTSLPNIGEKSGSHRNRASLLSAFRMWFNEDRKGKRKAGPASPEISYARGLTTPTPAGTGRGSVKVKRRTSGGPSRNSHRAKGPSISSHRSSSVNSRRSSNASTQMVILDSPYHLEHMMRQRSDNSRRSFGSHTPNSERGEYISSRPSSAHSFTHKHRHRKSPSASSAGSVHVIRTASPYHRRAGSGSSTRVVRSPAPASRSAHIRSSSTTSSIHSSRPGSFYEASDDGRTSSPFRTHSRRPFDETPRRGSGTSTFVAQKRQTPFLPPAMTYSTSAGRSSWKKAWGLEPPGWQTRTTHLPIEVLAISPAGDGPSSIRDVFSGRQSLSLGDESDWVDEDDDGPAFAGGLGQLASSVTPSPVDQTFGGYPVEQPVMLAAAPRGNAARAAGKRAAKGGAAKGGAAGQGHRSKAGHSPIGRISPLPNDAAFEGGSGTRRQLPNNRPGPAFRGHAIQEEDEDEEE